MRNYAVLLSFAGLLPFAAGVRAHGADWEVRMVGQRVGVYDLTVRTAPKQPRVGRLHLEIQLIDPLTLRYVEEAAVRASARFRGGTNDQAGPADSRFRSPWHEIDLVLRKSGSWEIDLAIEGPRARGNASFRLDILPEDKR